jgi:alpha,alpha-trehalase
MSFVDMVPAARLSRILKAYQEQRHLPGFNLSVFVQNHFELPPVNETYVTNPSHTIEEHIDEVWGVLERTQHSSKGSLIGLPHPYIVAGGRFHAMYYWDSYFVMLGLAVSGKWRLVEDMTKNFAFLLRKFGRVPNGNRSYLTSRSQPPFFAMMIQLLRHHKGRRTLVYYLPYLLLEHHFWIKGSTKLRRPGSSAQRVVRMPGNEILNRYFDDKTTPRPEGYREDVNMVLTSSARQAGDLNRDLRAAAESGWDFSARWCKVPDKLATIHTTDIVPVDLNCLLYVLEQTIAEAYTVLRSPRLASRYTALAEKRAQAINTYCWDSEKGFYLDYDMVLQQRTPVMSLAGAFPLYTGIATQAQADVAATVLQKTFLQHGGLLTTTLNTGQQWDAPNGWAPLQWAAIQGLRNYGYDELADEIKKRWLATNVSMYHATGKLVEKYNMVEPSKSAGGGEYQLQDGFGWTNGVLMALLHEDKVKWK